MATRMISFRTLCLLGLTTALAFTAAACGPPESRLNAPPQGWSSRQADMQQHYVYMVDNQLVADMHVSDVHFVPHQAFLNGLGARRIDRYAELTLKENGGTLHLDTDVMDDALVSARIESIKRYLAAANVDVSKVNVTVGTTAVAGLPASEAISGREMLGPAIQKEGLLGGQETVRPFSQ